MGRRKRFRFGAPRGARRGRFLKYGDGPSQLRRRSETGPGSVPGGWCLYSRVRRSGASVLVYVCLRRGRENGPGTKRREEGSEGGGGW